MYLMRQLNNKPRCDKCVNAIIYEDRNYDYTPSLMCRLEHETIEAGIMEFYPKEHTCKDFEKGDSEYT